MNTTKLTGIGRNNLHFSFTDGPRRSEELAPWWSDSGNRKLEAGNPGHPSKGGLG